MKRTVKFIHPYSLALGVLWVMTLFVILKLTYKPIGDPDLWWHLAHGRYMMEYDTILKKDVFSHTLLGTPFINYEWLVQILYYKAVQLFGFKGFFTFVYILCLGSLFFLWLSLRVVGARGGSALLLFWVGFKIIYYRFDARADLLTLLLLPLFVWLIFLARERPMWAQWKIPLTLFFLMVLWANMHGGFVYGLGFLFLIMIGARWSRQPAFWVRFLERSSVMALLATLINPFGPKLYQLILEVIFILKLNKQYLGEWASPSLDLFPYYWMLFFLVGVLLCISVMRFSQVGKLWGALILAFLVWSSGSARATPLLAFTALPFCIAVFKQVFKMNKKVFKEPNKDILKWVLCLFLFVANGIDLMKPIPSSYVQWHRLPVGSCEFIKKNNVQGTMFNTLGYGGYIAWALGPDIKHFMDGRLIFFPLFMEFENLANKESSTIEGWRSYFQKYRVDMAITPHGNSVLGLTKEGTFQYVAITDVMFPREEWALLYWDDASLVHVKREEKFKDAIKKYEYKALNPSNLNSMSLWIGSNRVTLSAAQQEIERHEKEVGPTRRSRQIKDFLTRFKAGNSS